MQLMKTIRVFVITGKKIDIQKAVKIEKIISRILVTGLSLKTLLILAIHQKRYSPPDSIVSKSKTTRLFSGMLSIFIIFPLMIS